MDLKKVSSAADLEGAAFEVVELPVVQSRDGNPFTIRLGGAPIESMVEFYKAFPRLGKSPLEAPADDAPEEDRWRWVAEIEEHARKLLEMGCTSDPAISFDDDAPAGSIPWTKLHVVNRGRIVASWINLTGLGQANSRLERVSSFLAGQPGGGPVRTSAGGTVPDGVAAP